MTPIAKRKTTIRAEPSANVRGRALIIELGAYTVRLREKGRRHWLEASWEGIYMLAAKAAALKARQERKTNRRMSRTGHA